MALNVLHVNGTTSDKLFTDESSLMPRQTMQEKNDPASPASGGPGEDSSTTTTTTDTSPVRAIISKIEQKVAKQQRQKEEEEEKETTRRSLSRNSTFNTQQSRDTTNNNEIASDNGDQEDKDHLQEELQELHKQVDTDVHDLEHLEQDFRADIERIMSHGSLSSDYRGDKKHDKKDGANVKEKQENPSAFLDLFDGNLDDDVEATTATKTSKGQGGIGTNSAAETTTGTAESSQAIFRQKEPMENASHSRNQRFSQPDSDDITTTHDHQDTTQLTTTIQKIESLVAQAEDRLSLELEQVQHASQDRRHHDHNDSNNPQEPQSHDHSSHSHEEESVTSRSVEEYQRHKEELIHAFEDESEAEDKEIHETEARILDYEKQKEAIIGRAVEQDDTATNTPNATTRSHGLAWESSSPPSKNDPTLPRQPTPAPSKNATIKILSLPPPLYADSSHNKIQKRLQRQVYRHQSWLLPALGMIMSNLASTTTGTGNGPATFSFGPQMSCRGITLFEFRI